MPSNLSQKETYIANEINKISEIKKKALLLKTDFPNILFFIIARFNRPFPDPGFQLLWIKLYSNPPSLNEWDFSLGDQSPEICRVNV